MTTATLKLQARNSQAQQVIDSLHEQTQQIWNESLAAGQVAAQQAADEAKQAARKTACGITSSLVLLSPILIVAFFMLLACHANLGMVGRLFPVFGFAIVIVPLANFMTVAGLPGNRQ